MEDDSGSQLEGTAGMAGMAGMAMAPRALRSSSTEYDEEGGATEYLCSLPAPDLRAGKVEYVHTQNITHCVLDRCCML